MSPFLIGSNSSVVSFMNNSRLPYLEDASNIPSIHWYVWLETRLLGQKTIAKLLIHEWTKTNGVHGYLKTK